MKPPPMVTPAPLRFPAKYPLPKVVKFQPGQTVKGVAFVNPDGDTAEFSASAIDAIKRRELPLVLPPQGAEGTVRDRAPSNAVAQAIIVAAIVGILVGLACFAMTGGR